MTTLQHQIQELHQAMKPLTAQQRVALAFEEFGDDMVLTTSFGPTAGAMLRLATRVNPAIRVVTIRHGYESKRTLEIADEMVGDWGLNLRVYEAPHMIIPSEDTPEFEEFKRKVKLEPFARALGEENPRAWLSGVMHDETEERRTFDFAMERDGRIAIYPILDWGEHDAEEFSLAHGLPINTTYYDPTKGLDQKQECGLHLGGLGSSWTSSGL